MRNKASYTHFIYSNTTLRHNPKFHYLYPPPLGEAHSKVTQAAFLSPLRIIPSMISRTM